MYYRDKIFKFVIRKNTGVFGYFAGPQVYIIDYLALSDPLLARLPAIYDLNWRIGHFERVVPEGYLQTVYNQKNLLTDPNLAAYYDKLSLAISGNLFDPQRWLAIWQLNTGQLNDLIDQNVYRFPEMQHLTCGLSKCTEVPANFEDNGIELQFSTLQSGQQISFILRGGQSFAHRIFA